MAKRMSHEEFENRIKEKQPEIKLLSKYVNAKTRIKCQCKTCGHIWETSPDSLNQGCGCPHCANLRKGKTKLKTHEEFVKELYEINPNIKILGKYVNARTKIKCICLIDGFEWEATPDNLLRMSRTPVTLVMG